MGWNIDGLFIRHCLIGSDTEAFLHGLGYKVEKAIGEELYQQAIWPEAHSVWAAQIADSAILSSQGVSERFLRPAPDEFMKQIFKQFPGAEICAVGLHSVVNYWGFAVFKDGILLRSKAGSGDDGTFCDEGELLPEEQKLLSHSTVEDGERVYRLPNYPGENLTEDQVGEEFVFAMFERFTGLRPDRDSALYELHCKGFRVRNPGDSLLRDFFRRLIG